jgi:tRNA (adenine57-N1/adenine58-N1)-methyltransferase
MILENDIIIIRYADKVYIKKAQKGQSISIKSNILKYDDIIGKEEGLFKRLFCGETHA